MVINFLFESVLPHFDKNNFKKLVKKTAGAIFADENKNCDILNFRFCSDIVIREYNEKYLSHDYETDILTFFYENSIDSFDGDILISTDTIKENSKRFKTSFLDELFRVVIHGVLHLCGYEDSTKTQKSQMRKKENFYIKKFVS